MSSGEAPARPRQADKHKDYTENNTKDVGFAQLGVAFCNGILAYRGEAKVRRVSGDHGARQKACLLSTQLNSGADNAHDKSYRDEGNIRGASRA